ncbi:GAF domain-containing sensor histidine kinase [Mammaliicoccus stepanovicii]|uniref:histidine kinase n=1 Tax=Mammaliicoccus stepanovicii TaxID=643214 RepID=A0A239YWI0_9STAP|nr:GAF domain-containing sensor histidine kinase [Mammaliicoccus stepanovicii]PNZ75597.1 histidine kinase [Mammaliicoccus stepanovicii]GGI40629.1 sensor histidine kinase [Mammaliicoccus stepanovicii]SNV62923.1 signal transduction histidine kinase [Mammaliicoccus stepanovicii]
MEKPTRTSLLKEIAEFLNEETEMYSMMHGALKKLVGGSNFHTGWIFFIDEDGQHELVAEEALPPALTHNQCQYMTEGTCWCVTAYHNKKLTKASNIINCSRIVKATKEHHDKTDNITHHATVPLRSGDEQFGLLNIATPETKRYSEEDLELLESVAFQIGSAIKRIILTDQEKEAARINERNRLARDLHDSVNQMLFSLKITAHAAKGITDHEEAKKAFQTIEDTSQSAVNEMRALIWQLKPVGLEQGLVAAIKLYSQFIHIEPEFEVEGLIDLPNTIEENVYRIIQESLNNIHKHSGTNRGKIYLEQSKTQFKVRISDKGKGFNYLKKEKTVSHGLRNMKQRTQVMKGHIDIQSEENQGTIIELTIPL